MCDHDDESEDWDAGVEDLDDFDYDAFVEDEFGVPDGRRGTATMVIGLVLCVALILVAIFV